MGILTGITAKVAISGTPVTATAEATTTTDNKVYVITHELKRIISPLHPIIIHDNGVETEELFEIDYENGKIIFAEVDEYRVITADYKYVPITDFAEASKISVTESVETKETPRFGDTFKRKTAIIKDAEIEIEHFDTVDTFFTDALNNGSVVFVRLYKNNDLYKTYMVIVDSDSLNVEALGIQNKKVVLKATKM